jgi:hypothetical protein
MIKGLSGSVGIDVSGGNVSIPYIGPNHNNPVQGMIRINNTDMEVFNGTGWQTLNTSYATVSLDDDTQSLLQWARKERTRQIDRERKAQEHPSLQKALEAIERAEANFDLLDKITNSEKQAEVSN